ncbi:hypothetical protein AB0E27_15320 [Streptomyces sparsogenes]|uniref:hypothetical protein n=1 Tax=Streptomyces sparsogenes TaxID=67365 RepID=UPI0033E4DF44
MRCETRGGMYFGVRPSKDQIVEMVDEIKTILGAPVETAYLCHQLGYWVRNFHPGRPGR